MGILLALACLLSTPTTPAHATTQISTAACGPAGLLVGLTTPGVPKLSGDCTIQFGNDTADAQLRLYQADGAGTAMPGIGDWSFGVADWNDGASMFAGCLQAVSGTNVVAGGAPWSVDPDGDCTPVDTDPWNPIPTTSSAAAVIANSPDNGYTDATATLVWGLRVDTQVPAGGYSSGLTFEVLAPSLVAPSNTSLPTVTGTADEGSVLTADVGTWTGTAPISYTYQWRRCDSVGAGCVNVAGATSATFTLGAVDVGSTMRVVVTGTNEAGTAAATSGASARVTGDPPTNTVLPTISGTANHTSTLTATTGSWTYSGSIGYAYQWRRCDSLGLACADIVGATASTYVLAAADVGATLRVVVTATNNCWSGCGPTSATSVQSARVTGDPPVNNTAPVVSGTVEQEQVLGTSNGLWWGTPTIGFSYQWQRCSSSTDMTTCVNIPGATASTYGLVAADVGSWIRSGVIGTNACWSGCGSGIGYSAVTAQVQTVQVPVGSIVAHGGSTLPAGWLWADGAAVSRATHAALFAVAGTTYGAGDGSTTFNVPNLRQRLPLGQATAGTGATLGGTGGAIDHAHPLASHFHAIATGGGHTHTVASHGHTSPGHDHSHNLTTGNAGAHDHDAGTGDSFWIQGGTGTLIAHRAIGGTETVHVFPSTTNAGAHSHNVTGTIGNASGNNGNTNSAMGTAAPAANTALGHAHGAQTGSAAPGTSAENAPFQVTEYIVKSTPGAANPCGLIWATGRAAASTGSVLADGAARSRTTDATLHGCLGTAFGAGDGSTTFNLPDLRQRHALGRATAGTGSTRGATGGSIDHTHTASHAHSIGSDGAHTLTVPAHNHTVFAHFHNHNLDTGTTGGHNHQPNNGGDWIQEWNGGNSSVVMGGRNYSLTGGGTTSTAGGHSHNVSGTVGNTSGDNGNQNMPATAGAMVGSTDGDHDHGAATLADAATTSAANAPFQAVNFELSRSAGGQPAIGSITPFAGSTPPAGWVVADGRTLSRSSYPELFTAIGTAFGAGDGSTTFQVPDLRQRFTLGKAASGTGAVLGSTGGAIDHTHVASHGHGITTDGAHAHTLPSHTATVPGHYHNHNLDTNTAGAHNHSMPNGSSPVWQRASGAAAWAECGGCTRPMKSVMNTNTEPAHNHVNVNGTVGNSSGANGNTNTASTASSPGVNTLGGHDHGGAATANPSTGAHNAPFLVVTYIIKVRGA